MVKMSVKVVRKNGRSKFSAEEKKLRQEASRLASLANKRLKRLEQQNLLESPAYKSWVDNGKVKFSVRGKTMEQVKAEVGRLNHFIEQSTSTVKGAKTYFINIAKNVGITEYKDIPDLQNKLNNFFEITAKVKEYLYNSKEIGVSIGYQKIWEIVSDYVQEVGGETENVEEAVLDVARKLVPATVMKQVDETLDAFLDGF